MLFAAQMFEGLLYGYLGIIIYMILTGCGLPMPEEVAIVAGGALAAGGKLDPWLTLGALLIGAILGDCVMYAIGHHFGRRIMKANRLGAAFLTPEREARVEALLSRHGAKVLFFARFLVGIRGPIYITAGILKMPFRKFLLADLVCAGVVVSLFFAASYFYGQKIIQVIHDGEGILTLVVITALVVAGIGFLWYQLHYKKKLPGLGMLEEDAGTNPVESELPASKGTTAADDDLATACPASAGLSGSGVSGSGVSGSGLPGSGPSGSGPSNGVSANGNGAGNSSEAYKTPAKEPPAAH